MKFNTPVLLITFNRPDHTKKVINEIKKVEPSSIFVFQDGPRKGNLWDDQKCREVKQIIKDQINWECNIYTKFEKDNLGCGMGPVEGINWFFGIVEYGIIIEDDSIPIDEFFYFAEAMLLRYKDNIDIRAVCSMKIDKCKYGEASYYYSMMNRNLCAWATWKRAWNDFDYYLKNKDLKDLQKALRRYSVTKKEIDYWSKIFDIVVENRFNDTCWDIQFLMSIWFNNGKGICPNSNLSTNIGFGYEATHTQDSNNIASCIPTQRILPLTFANNEKINRKADMNYHKLFFQPDSYGMNSFKKYLSKAIRKTRKIFKIFRNNPK
jgi:hypothetical protein